MSSTNKHVWKQTKCHNYASLCSLREGREGGKATDISIFLWITGIKTNKLQIFFFGLIAKLVSVCDGCEVGLSEVNNIYCNQVAIFVLTWIMIEADVRTAASVNISFVLPLTVSRYNILELVCSSNWMIYE